MQAGCKYDLKKSKYRLEDIIYNTSVNSDLEKKLYTGLRSTQFRFRCANYKKSFKDGVYEHETELLKYICNLSAKKKFRITWK